MFVPTRKKVMKLGIKKGTKLTDSPKDQTLKFRLDAQTSERLRILSEKTGQPKAKVIRDGIDAQYEKVKDK